MAEKAEVHVEAPLDLTQCEQPICGAPRACIEQGLSHSPVRVAMLMVARSQQTAVSVCQAYCFHFKPRKGSLAARPARSAQPAACSQTVKMPCLLPDAHAPCASGSRSESKTARRLLQGSPGPPRLQLPEY